MTVADLLKSSLRVCKVLAKGEVPSPDETADSTQALQFMLDAWGADNLMVWSHTPKSFALTAGQRSYTIGVGGSFDYNTTYPYAIIDAYLRDGNGVDTGIDVLTRAEYDSYNDKIISSSRPEAIYYDHGVGNQTTPSGTIFVYPIPDGSTTYTLFFTAQEPLLSIVSSTQTFTLLAPYEEAVKYNLALRLWDEFHEKEPIPQHIVMLAKESKALIERNSLEMEISGISIPSVKTGIWNILSDTEMG